MPIDREEIEKDKKILQGKIRTWVEGFNAAHAQEPVRVDGISLEYGMVQTFGESHPRFFLHNVEVDLIVDL